MIQRAITVFRDQGWRGVWFGALAWAGLYRRLELVELDLAALPTVAPLPEAFAVGFLGPDELDALAELGAQWTAHEAAERLARGERCFVARHDAEIVSARWVTTGEAYIRYVGRWLPVEPGDVYLYESYTDPARRGLGLSPALGTRLARGMAAEGHRRIVAGVLPESRAARRAYEKVGYRPAGCVGYVRLGPWRKDFLRVAAR